MVECFEDECESLIDLGSSDIKRRDESEGFGAGGGNEEAFFQKHGAQVDGRGLVRGNVESLEIEADPNEETVAPDFGDGGVVPACDGFPDLSGAGFDVFNEIFPDDGFDDRFGSGSGEGVASIGGAMAARSEKGSVFFVHPKGTDWESAAHALGP